MVLTMYKSFLTTLWKFIIFIFIYLYAYYFLIEANKKVKLPGW